MDKIKTNSTLAEMLQDIMGCPFIEKVPDRPEQIEEDE